MTNREPYSYVVLRYVHDVVSGEFLNVGFVMAVPDRSLVLTRSRKTFGRLKKAFPDLDGAAYRSAMKAVERSLKKIARDAANEGLLRSGRTAKDFARLAVPDDDSSLQWSTSGFGVTANPDLTFEQLYRRFVTRYDTSAVQHRTDDDVWRLVTSELKERSVPLDLETKVVRGTTDSVEFEHAWKNGKWHVYEPLSFDLADAENIKDKARRLLGHLTAVGSSDEDLRLNFIVGRPQSPALEPAYRNAIEIIRRVPFENAVYEDDAIDIVVDMIEDDVRNHAEGSDNSGPSASYA